MLAQLLLAVSFVAATYQDVKERAVHDLVWIPALAGAAYVVYLEFPNLGLLIIKVALVGGIALAFTLTGGIGQADAIALAIIAVDPYQLSPILPLFGAAMVALAHIGYEFFTGNARGTKTIPMEKFLREQRWIPKAIVSEGGRTEVNKDVNVAREEVEARKDPQASVEVAYGVPTVAYLGVGYLIYLVYLLVFNQPAFLSLP